MLYPAELRDRHHRTTTKTHHKEPPQKPATKTHHKNPPQNPATENPPQKPPTKTTHKTPPQKPATKTTHKTPVRKPNQGKKPSPQSQSRTSQKRAKNQTRASGQIIAHPPASCPLAETPANLAPTAYFVPQLAPIVRPLSTLLSTPLSTLLSILLSTLFCPVCYFMSAPSASSASCSVMRLPRRRRGISLLETIGVLVAAIIILSGAAALAHRAYNDHRVNAAIADLPVLVDLTRETGAQFGGAYREASMLHDIFAAPKATAPSTGARVGRLPPLSLSLEISATPTPITAANYTLTHNVGGTSGTVHIGGVTASSNTQAGFGSWFHISYTELRQQDCLRLLLESPTHAQSGLLGIVVSGAYNAANLRATMKSMMLNRGDLTNTIFNVGAGSAQFIPPSLPAAGSGGAARPAHFGSTNSSVLPVSVANANTVCNSDDLTITWMFI